MIMMTPMLITKTLMTRMYLICAPVPDGVNGQAEHHASPWEVAFAGLNGADQVHIV